MKKSYLIIAVVLLTGFTANAQLSVGAGYQGQNRREQISRQALGTTDASNNWYNGFYAGLNYNIHLVAGLNIAPGLHFTYNTFSNEGNVLIAGTPVFTKIKDVEMGLKLPVLLNYRFNFRDGKFILAPFAGVTFGYALSGKTATELTSDFPGFSGTEVSDDFDKDLYGGNAAPNRFDLYTSVGIMLMFNHFRFNVGYDLGLLNRMEPLNKSSFGAYYETNETLSNLNIGIGYEF